MKRLGYGFSAFLSLAIASPAFAQATCKLNGEVVPCDQMPGWLMWIPIVFVLLGLGFFVFWLMMLMDVIKYQQEDRTMWILIIIFLNVLGAVIYYFAEKRNRSDASRQQSNRQDQAPQSDKKQHN